MPIITGMPNTDQLEVLLQHNYSNVRLSVKKQSSDKASLEVEYTETHEIGAKFETILGGDDYQYDIDTLIGLFSDVVAILESFKEETT